MPARSTTIRYGRHEFPSKTALRQHLKEQFHIMGEPVELARDSTTWNAYIEELMDSGKLPSSKYFRNYYLESVPENAEE